jgi:phage-related tail fiber protein
MPIFRGKDFVSAASDNKDSVRVATRTNIELTSLVYSIDGVTLVGKNRVLLAGQTNPAQNGIYVWNAITSKLVRAADADSGTEVSAGLKIYVEEGVQNSQSNWTLITPGLIVLGSTRITFAKENRIGHFDYSGTYGSASKSAVVTVDESGQISSIEEIDISLDAGFF